MSTQIISFILFGIIFILLYFFYKSENRKIALLIGGLVLISPLFFGMITLSESEAIASMTFASLFLLIFVFYKGKNRYFLLLPTFYFFLIPLTFKHLQVLNNESSPKKTMLLTSSKIFQFDNGTELVIDLDEGALVNNTPNKLYIEKLVYGESLFEEDNTQNTIVDSIEPYSVFNNPYYIEYYFQQPPSVIEVNVSNKSTTNKKTIQYWLHK